MMAERIQQNDAEAEIHEAFRVFAKDSNGHIPMDELKYGSYSEAHVQE